MNQLLSDNLWPTIKQLAKQSEIKRAALAYVSSDEFLKFGEGDILVADASDTAIRTGLTNARVLASAKKRGAELYSLPGLHAKIMQLGRNAVIGSANASLNSVKGLVEAAWVTDEPDAVALTGAMVLDFVDRAQEINSAFLKRIQAINVVTRPHRIVSERQATTKRKEPTHRTWLVGLRELVKDYSDEDDAVQKGHAVAERRRSKQTGEVEWARITGRSKFRAEAKRGDSIIEIYRSATAKRPSAVYKAAQILHCQDEPNCTRIWVETLADADDHSLRWRQFQRLAERVGLPEIGPDTMRLVPLHQAKAMSALWDSFVN